MKKLAILLFAVVTFTACKQEKKTETKVAATETFQLDTETVIVNWVGYKFTEKKGVKGQFKTVTVTNNNKAETLEKALLGSAVSIPVSSIFSNNEIRDNKLKSIFFGAMEHTELLAGKITSVAGNAGVMSLTMNNETHDLPFTLTKQGNTAYLKATIDLHIWHAAKALEAIHKACEVLHTGADGVSKTWNVVDIDVVLNFTK